LFFWHSFCREGYFSVNTAPEGAQLVNQVFCSTINLATLSFREIVKQGSDETYGAICSFFFTDLCIIWDYLYFYFFYFFISCCRFKTVEQLTRYLLRGAYTGTILAAIEMAKLHPSTFLFLFLHLKLDWRFFPFIYSVLLIYFIYLFVRYIFVYKRTFIYVWLFVCWFNLFIYYLFIFEFICICDLWFAHIVELPGSQKLYLTMIGGGIFAVTNSFWI
jgi:hypothetical protein